jgi:hypothetical protein
MSAMPVLADRNRPSVTANDEKYHHQPSVLANRLPNRFVAARNG